MRSSLLPHFESLITQSRKDGLDTRPVLARVVTDLYVQEPHHTPEEERRFAELIGGLLDTIDVASRAAIAKRLAAYHQAPRALLRRLAEDVIAVAAPVLSSPVLPEEERAAIARRLGGAHAAAFHQSAMQAVPAAPIRATAAPVEPPQRPVTMPEVPRSVREMFQSINERLAQPILTPRTVPEARPEPAVAAPDHPPAAETALPAAAVAEPVEEPAAEIAVDAPAPAPRPGNRGDAFFAADSNARRAALQTLAADATAAAATIDPARAADAVRRLEAAALQRKARDFAWEIERALEIPRATAAQITADPSGEALVAALAALATPPDVVLRVLLFLNPAIGQSVARVFELVQLHRELKRETALRLVQLWQGEAPAVRAPRHQPYLAPDQGRVRRGAAEPQRSGQVRMPIRERTGS